MRRLEVTRKEQPVYKSRLPWNPSEGNCSRREQSAVSTSDDREVKTEN